MWYSCELWLNGKYIKKYNSMANSKKDFIINTYATNGSKYEIKNIQIIR